MGNNLKWLSANVALLADDQTWIEGSAIQQLQTTATLAGIECAVGMPDLHPGRGYPVGAAFWSRDVFYPALVGNDIGCGMALLQTDLLLRDASAEKLDKRLGNIDTPLDESWQARLHALQVADLPCAGSLGTIGGGNHFAELQAIDAIFDHDVIESLSINPKQLLLLAHSGSRGLGEWILRHHVDAVGHRSVAANDSAGLWYLQQHDLALRYARANRQLIAERIAHRLRCQLQPILDVHHNFVESCERNGEIGWLHRKGATPANAGLVVIPGSRGDYSYLVAPSAAPDALWSLPHGAGRKWKRGDCKARLQSRYRHDQLQKTAFGSRVICNDRELIYDEAPEAYKPIESIINVMEQEGLIHRIARLKPVLTYKTRGECCE